GAPPRPRTAGASRGGAWAGAGDGRKATHAPTPWPRRSALRLGESPSNSPLPPAYNPPPVPPANPPPHEQPRKSDDGPRRDPAVGRGPQRPADGRPRHPRRRHPGDPPRLPRPPPRRRRGPRPHLLGRVVPAVRGRRPRPPHRGDDERRAAEYLQQ